MAAITKIHEICKAPIEFLNVLKIFEIELKI